MKKFILAPLSVVLSVGVAYANVDFPSAVYAPSPNTSQDFIKVLKVDMRSMNLQGEQTRRGALWALAAAQTFEGIDLKAGLYSDADFKVIYDNLTPEQRDAWKAQFEIWRSSGMLRSFDLVSTLQKAENIRLNQMEIATQYNLSGQSIAEGKRAVLNPATGEYVLISVSNPAQVQTAAAGVLNSTGNNGSGATAPGPATTSLSNGMFYGPALNGSGTILYNANGQPAVSPAGDSAAVVGTMPVSGSLPIIVNGGVATPSGSVPGNSGSGTSTPVGGSLYSGMVSTGTTSTGNPSSGNPSTSNPTGIFNAPGSTGGSVPAIPAIAGDPNDSERALKGSGQQIATQSFPGSYPGVTVPQVPTSTPRASNPHSYVTPPSKPTGTLASPPPTTPFNNMISQNSSPLTPPYDNSGPLSPGIESAPIGFVPAANPSAISDLGPAVSGSWGSWNTASTGGSTGTNPDYTQLISHGNNLLQQIGMEISMVYGVESQKGSNPDQASLIWFYGGSGGMAPTGPGAGPVKPGNLGNPNGQKPFIFNGGGGGADTGLLGNGKPVEPFKKTDPNDPSVSPT